MLGIHAQSITAGLSCVVALRYFAYVAHIADILSRLRIGSIVGALDHKSSVTTVRNLSMPYPAARVGILLDIYGDFIL